MNFDHAVIVVTGLERAVVDYTELGFKVTPGGEHADGRTHNALISFADGSYIELIAFRRGIEAADHPWWRFAQAGGALGDWALRTDALEARVEQLRAAGVPLEQVRDGGRLRPDGERLAWKSTRPAPERGLPFLIEDVTPRELRVPRGPAVEHPNGALGVAAVVVAADSFEPLAGHFARLLELPAAGPVPDPLLSTDTLRFPCRVTHVVLAHARERELKTRVERHGTGPYALVLAARSAPSRSLEVTNTHGAALFLEASLDEP